MKNELAKQEAAITPAQMIQAVIEKGVTAENVAALEKLCDLQERFEARSAEKAFAAAFVALQADLRGIQATKAIPDSKGGIRYKYAPLEVLMDMVGPKLEAHGFTISFSTDYKDNRLIKTCTLQHIGGHSRSNTFAVRIGNVPGCNDTQNDGAAGTYAKRYALCDALNIVIEHDDDARAEGASITAEQAAEIQRLVIATGSDKDKFLKFCGASDYESIPAAKHKHALAMLQKKAKS